MVSVTFITRSSTSEASFLGIGTANGAGTTAGISNCANDYDPLWSVYVDGEIGGEYFCEDVQLDAYGAGTNPKFVLEYAWCPSQSANRWNLYFGGTLWRCKSAGATGATQARAGLETTGTSDVDRNIDVRYTELNINRIGNTSWLDFNYNGRLTDPNYSWTHVSSTAFDVYLHPLD